MFPYYEVLKKVEYFKKNAHQTLGLGENQMLFSYYYAFQTLSFLVYNIPIKEILKNSAMKNKVYQKPVGFLYIKISNLLHREF